MKKFYFYIAFISVCLFISCEIEEIPSKKDLEIRNTEDPLDISLKISRTSEKDLKNLDHFLGELGLKKSIYNKMTSDLEIDTQSILKLKNGNYTSYTLKLNREIDNGGYSINLVVEKKFDTIEAFLMKYRYSQRYLDSLSKGIKIPFEGAVSRTKPTKDISILLKLLETNEEKSKKSKIDLKLKSSEQTCVTTYITTAINCESGKHGPEDVCNYKNPSRWGYYTTRAVTNCFSSGYPGWSDETEQLDYIALDENSGASNPNIAPNIEQCENCNTNTLAKDISSRLGLFSNQEEWLEKEGGEIFTEQVANFLLTNGNTEGENFARQAIKAKMAGGAIDFIYKVIIDASFKNDECLNGIYEAMGKASAFDDYLKRFDSDMSVANLQFGYEINFGATYPDHASAIAITNPPLFYLIKIDFNGDPALPTSIHGKSKLIIATSLIHELLHAEMYRKMLAVARQPDLNFTQWYIQDPYSFEKFKADLKHNFFGIWDFYSRFEWDILPGQEPSSAQHQQLSQNYRNVIISAISEYDNYQHSPEVYEALSWYGLMGTGDYDPATGLFENSTEAWKSIDDDPNLTAAEERKKIHSTILNFQSNDADTCN